MSVDCGYVETFSTHWNVCLHFFYYSFFWMRRMEIHSYETFTVACKKFRPVFVVAGVRMLDSCKGNCFCANVLVVTMKWKTLNMSSYWECGMHMGTSITNNTIIMQSLWCSTKIGYSFDSWLMFNLSLLSSSLFLVDDHVFLVARWAHKVWPICECSKIFLT